MFVSTYALSLMLALGVSPSIDSILKATWQSRGIQPGMLCSDEEFLRRASLDIIGRIPTVQEIHRFKKDPDRRAVIDGLLARDEFPKFWSELWTATLVGYVDASETDREVLRTWLEKSFQRDTPYDEIVTKLITATGTTAFDGPTNFLIRHEEDPAVNVCRLFLGVRLDCARCHDHPFDRWTQDDFERMNLFFEATDRREVSEGNVRLVNVRPDEDERPRFLTGARPRTSQWRDELALFMTRSKPFARTFGNRLWYHFMGRGIVHPPDDFNQENPPAIPELLELLAENVRQNKFAIKPMIRLICNSHAYQVSSERAVRNKDHEAVFAYRVLKPLTPEQTFDSAVIALGLPRDVEERNEFIERTVGESLDEDFSQTWEYRETVQGLMQRLNISPRMTAKSVDLMYLRILSRAPTLRERKICAGRAPEDIVFALINSNEFFFNH